MLMMLSTLSRAKDSIKYVKPPILIDTLYCWDSFDVKNFAAVYLLAETYTQQIRIYRRINRLQDDNSKLMKTEIKELRKARRREKLPAMGQGALIGAVIVLILPKNRL